MYPEVHQEEIFFAVRQQDLPGPLAYYGLAPRRRGIVGQEGLDQWTPCEMATLAGDADRPPPWSNPVATRGRQGPPVRNVLGRMLVLH